MRYRRGELEKRIKEFAENFYSEKNRSPSMSEIAKAMNISKDTVHRYVHMMNDKGEIKYDGRTILTKKLANQAATVRAGIFDGSIPCGPPEVIEASVSEYVNLPIAIFGKKNYYIIRTTGESMINAGIESGDMVVVEETHEPEYGKIVVALHDNENTLKRLRYDEKRNCPVLIPENDHMDSIYVDKLEIQGVARFVIKAL